MSRIAILNWNVAGVNLLKEEDAKKRMGHRSRLNEDLRLLLRKQPAPDIVTLQEVVAFGEAHAITETFDPPEGYFYKSLPVIDSRNQPHPRKLPEYRRKLGLSESGYVASGLGFLWRRELNHSLLWSLDSAASGELLEVEGVRLDTGLYTGSRDTEPRLAAVAHFVIPCEPVARDLFVVNLHLTTLEGEREGKPERDFAGARLRLRQIETVLTGIVSRYNAWRDDQLGNLPRVVWLLVGDLNCTPQSAEIARLRRAGFVDLHRDKRLGTKRSGLAGDAQLTVDYIFAGPEFVALHPQELRKSRRANPKPIDDVTSSDHFPLLATVSL